MGCFWALGDISSFSFKSDEPGIRESCHLPSWSSLVRRSPRSRGVLHHPLRGHLREDRHEDFNLRDPTTGDPHQGQRHRLRQRHHVLQGESFTKYVNENHDNDAFNQTITFKVADATCAVANVDDYSGSSRLLAATTLRFELL